MAASNFRLSLLVLLTIFTSCSKNVVAPEDHPTEISITCYDEKIEFIDNSRPFVVRTAEEYAELQRKLHHDVPTCTEDRFPAIDFSRHSLLGKRTFGSGCTMTVPVERMRVRRDSATRTVTWTIVHVEHGACEPIHIHTSWILVPPIDTGDLVTYEVVTERVG
jgi:hypothetical protein